MSDKKNAMLLFGSIEQFRENGVLLVGNLIRAAIESTLLPESKLTLKEFLNKRVFSNAGFISNEEICAVAQGLFGEQGATHVATLEARGALEKFGYSRDEMRVVRDALDALHAAEVHLVSEVPERLHVYEDLVCVAVGFRFAKHNRHHP